MDIAISSQFSILIRWAAAFILIYMILPAILFPFSGGSVLERLFSRYVRMVALTIVVGYILVALKLYELLSMLFVFLMIAILVKLPTNNRKQAFLEMRDTFSLRIYDFLDGKSHPYQLLRQRFTQKLINLKTKINESINLPNIMEGVLLVSVLAYATYLRFYDALRHAAPSMSDASVALSWTKYINERVLFYDGIYPHGSHIYMSILNKFAACDTMYILKYTGPLSGVLTTLGIYLFVNKLTGRKIPGILSAFIYGVLGGILTLEWERQAATNSQEFAIIFLLPSWNYAISYLQTREKKYLWSAFAAFLVMGFVHTLIYAFLWVGLGCIVIAYFLLNTWQVLRPVGLLITAGIMSGVVSALPLLIALLFGQSFNQSSLEYLTSTMQASIPTLTYIDVFAFIGCITFLIISIWKKKDGTNLEISLFVFLLGVASFLMYIFIGPITGKEVLVGRIGILWSLIACVGIGIASEVLLKIIPGTNKMLGKSIVAIFALAIMVGTVIQVKPTPPQPYKMQYDVEVNQYLRIREEFLTSNWTMVHNNEGYALALGKGWHIQLRDFLNWYDPQKVKLVRRDNGEPLDIPDLFIFIQKKLLIVDMKIMEPILAQRALDYAELQKWVAIYGEYHDNLSLFFEDDYIVVFRIHQPKSKEEVFKEIWGQGN